MYVCDNIFSLCLLLKNHHDAVVAGNGSEDIPCLASVDDYRYSACISRLGGYHGDVVGELNAYDGIAEVYRTCCYRFAEFVAQDIDVSLVRMWHFRDVDLLEVTRERALCCTNSEAGKSLQKFLLRADKLVANDALNGI